MVRHGFGSGRVSDQAATTPTSSDTASTPSSSDTAPASGMQEAGDLSRELRKSAMEDLLDEMFQTDVPTQDDNADVLTTIKREVDLYMAQLPTSLSSDPLVWWRDNATRFPYHMDHMWQP